MFKSLRNAARKATGKSIDWDQKLINAISIGDGDKIQLAIAKGANPMKEIEIDDDYTTIIDWFFETSDFRNDSFTFHDMIHNKAITDSMLDQILERHSAKLTQATIAALEAVKMVRGTRSSPQRSVVNSQQQQQQQQQPFSAFDTFGGGDFGTNHSGHHVYGEPYEGSVAASSRNAEAVQSQISNEDLRLMKAVERDNKNYISNAIVLGGNPMFSKQTPYSGSISLFATILTGSRWKNNIPLVTQIADSPYVTGDNLGEILTRYGQSLRTNVKNVIANVAIEKGDLSPLQGNVVNNELEEQQAASRRQEEQQRREHEIQRQARVQAEIAMLQVPQRSYRHQRIPAAASDSSPNVSASQPKISAKNQREARKNNISNLQGIVGLYTDGLKALHKHFDDNDIEYGKADVMALTSAICVRQQPTKTKNDISTLIKDTLGLDEKQIENIFSNSDLPDLDDLDFPGFVEELNFIHKACNEKPKNIRLAPIVHEMRIHNLSKDVNSDNLPGLVAIAVNMLVTKREVQASEQRSPSASTSTPPAPQQTLSGAPSSESTSSGSVEEDAQLARRKGSDDGFDQAQLAAALALSKAEAERGNSSSSSSASASTSQRQQPQAAASARNENNRGFRGRVNRNGNPRAVSMFVQSSSSSAATNSADNAATSQRDRDQQAGQGNAPAQREERAWLRQARQSQRGMGNIAAEASLRANARRGGNGGGREGV